MKLLVYCYSAGGFVILVLVVLFVVTIFAFVKAKHPSVSASATGNNPESGAGRDLPLEPASGVGMAVHGNQAYESAVSAALPIYRVNTVAPPTTAPTYSTYEEISVENEYDYIL